MRWRSDGCAGTSSESAASSETMRSGPKSASSSNWAVREASARLSVKFTISPCGSHSESAAMCGRALTRATSSRCCASDENSFRKVAGDNEVVDIIEEGLDVGVEFVEIRDDGDVGLAGPGGGEDRGFGVIAVDV